MIYEVVISRKADEQLRAIFRYIRNEASSAIAKRYTDAVLIYCAGFNIFPLRGNVRDDIRPGMRITNYKKRCAIAFDVEGDTVTIQGIFYGGQDYESLLANELND